MEEQHWLTATQLLALAASEGFSSPEISARKIERWRKADLLPRPRRISLGRGKGMRSEYAPETGRQFLAICRLRRRFPHDLDAIRFALWYEGYALPLADVKRSIEQLLTPLLRALPLGDPDPLDAAEQFVSQARSKSSRSRSGRRFKRLRNADEVDAVQIAILQLMLGDVPGFTAHAEEELGERSLIQLLLETLGLERAQTDYAGEAKPWLPQNNNEIARQLENMATEQLLSLPALLQILKKASSRQLALARTDLKRMLAFKQAAKAMEAMLGPNAFGFGFFSELPNDPGFRVLFLLFLLRLRGTPHRVGMDEIEATLQKAKPNNQRFLACLRMLRRERPSIAREILTQTRALDLSDPHAFDQLHTIFATAYTNHPEELQAFFQRHPELVPPEESV